MRALEEKNTLYIKGEQIVIPHLYYLVEVNPIFKIWLSSHLSSPNILSKIGNGSKSVSRHAACVIVFQALF